MWSPEQNVGLRADTAIAAAGGEVDDSTWQPAPTSPRRPPDGAVEELAHFATPVLANLFTNDVNHDAHMELDFSLHLDCDRRLAW
ncbi:hypothetical protein A9W97_17625 [Mycobacterium gordonae]|nr:hypothetical protein [Mycobacterium gordonae]OBJ87433.1 hypothetical protein A9W97_17625 [Mycobacterium gordonae]